MARSYKDVGLPTHAVAGMARSYKEAAMPATASHPATPM